MHIVPQRSSDLTPGSVESPHKKTVLQNGIRIVTEEISHVRSVSIGVWVDVGSRDERADKNGISHFVEHMVFKGTKHYRTHEIAQSLESVGGYLNAFTSKENTCFYARVLDEHLPKAIDVLSDLVQHPLFDSRELEKEKKVVLEEIKNLEDDPDDLIHDYFDRSLFPKHSLGYPVIGTSETITRLSRADLVTHLQNHYSPDRIVVAAAGNLKHESVVNLVRKHFRPGLHRNGVLKREHGPRTLQKKLNVFGKPITQAHICLGTIGYSVKHPQRHALLVLNTLLGEGMSSRLFQNIREKYGFAYSIYSFASFMSDTGNFGVYIGTDKRNIQSCIDLIYKELEKLRSKAVSKAELQRTKAQLKGTMMLSLENMPSRMMRLGSGELLFGDYVSVDEILKKVDSVSVDDVLETARRLFRVERFSTIIIEPTDKKATA